MSKKYARLLISGWMAIMAGLVPARGQTLIASNGFETADNWTISAQSGVATLTNIVGSADTPPNQRIRTGSYSWQHVNPGSTISTSIVDFVSIAAGSFTSRQVIVRVSSTSFPSPSNGADGGDILQCFVALDGAAFTATADVRLNGNSNARWGYWATNTARTYAGTYTTNAAPQANQSSNNASTVKIDIPNSATSVAVRVRALNDNTNEIWSVDDVSLVYDAPDWLGPIGPTTNVQFTSSAASAAESIGTYTVTVYKTLAAGNVSGNVALSGTATEGGGNDYTVNTTNFTMNGATTSATFVVTINDDAVFEPSETVILTLANVVGGTLSGPSVFTLTISANDAPPTLVTNVWINEIDYDTPGTDSNEWVELIGAAGANLNDYELVCISNAGATNTFDLAGAGWTFADEGGGFGYIVIGIVNPGEGTADYTPSGWTQNEIQNGPNDSIQLRLKTGPVNVHLVDYDGNNTTTTEDQSTSVADNNTSSLTSIYLTGGPGTNFTAFSWTNSSGSATPGAINNGQSLGTGSQTPPVLAAIGSKSVLTNAPLSFAVTATPTDGDTVTLSVSNSLPAGATFGSTNEIGTFEWLAPGPVGVYTMTFYAADNDGVDTEQITISVTSTPVDIDGDFMPNDWENQYFGGATNATATADDDGDGSLNIEEFVAQTIPVLPNGATSYFRNVSIAASNRSVGYPSVTGRQYRLWGSTNLIPGIDWTQVAGPQAGNGSSQSLQEGTSSTSSYFRLTVEMINP